MLLTLAGIGLLAGVVAGLSPCVLPVLPVLLATGAAQSPTGRRRRPALVIAGLVFSFASVTLLGSYLLDLLHLPQTSLEIAGLVLLGLVGLALLVPGLDTIVERPFARLASGARARGVAGRGFLLGVSLGLVFVPCAGPVLAAVTTLGAAHKFGLPTVVLTASYAIGTGIPLLAVASAGDAIGQRVKALRDHAVGARRVAGALFLAMVVLIASNVLAPLQRVVPGYSAYLQNKVEANSSVRSQITQLTGDPGCFATLVDRSALSATGCAAPELRGISTWLNTPGDKPLPLTSLRGHVVLVDFWTYSCINCQRTLPYLKAWYTRYASTGLTVVGVHTPEFAFEHSARNVRSQAHALGVKYPVAIDNDFATWNAYHNQYWPAEYLIDQNGVVRHIHFGEGDYDNTEQLIRTLLSRHITTLPPPAETAAAAGTRSATPETYLGYQQLNNLAAQELHPGATATYRPPPAIPPNTVAFAGTWTVGSEAARAESNAELLLRYTAQHVYLVLAGTGTVQVAVDGHPQPAIHVSGTPTLYELVSGPYRANRLLQLGLSPGLSAYDFTFG